MFAGNDEILKMPTVNYEYQSHRPPSD